MDGSDSCFVDHEQSELNFMKVSGKEYDIFPLNNQSNNLPNSIENSHHK